MSNYIVDPFQNFGPSPPPATRNSWVELARTTLGSPNSSIIVAGFARKRYLMVLVYSKGASFDLNLIAEFNSDVGTNYSTVIARNGGANVPLTNDVGTLVGGDNDFDPEFSVFFIDNNPVGEKLVRGRSCERSLLGVGNQPNRSNYLGKWSNVQEIITTLEITSQSAETFNTGSEVIVLGWDPSDGLGAPSNFWQKLANVKAVGSPTFLRTPNFALKKYLWVEAYANTSDIPASGWGVHVGNTTLDFAVNISNRVSFNDLGDFGGPANRLGFEAGSGSVEQTFMRYFMVNEETEEKLVIGNGGNKIQQGGSPYFTEEMVAKWVNVVSQIDIIGIERALAGGNILSGQLTVWGHD